MEIHDALPIRCVVLIDRNRNAWGKGTTRRKALRELRRVSVMATPTNMLLLDCMPHQVKMEGFIDLVVMWPKEAHAMQVDLVLHKPWY